MKKKSQEMRGTTVMKSIERQASKEKVTLSTSRQFNKKKNCGTQGEKLLLN